MIVLLPPPDGPTSAVVFPALAMKGNLVKYLLVILIGKIHIFKLGFPPCRQRGPQHPACLPGEWRVENFVQHPGIDDRFLELHPEGCQPPSGIIGKHGCHQEMTIARRHWHQDRLPAIRQTQPHRQSQFRPISLSAAGFLH